MCVCVCVKEKEIACASLASNTDFMLPFTVFRVHLPGRNRFDFLLFGKLFFPFLSLLYCLPHFFGLYEEVVTVCFSTTGILSHAIVFVLSSFFRPLSSPSSLTLYINIYLSISHHKIHIYSG